MTQDRFGTQTAVWSRNVNGEPRIESSTRLAGGTWSMPVRLGIGSATGIGTDRDGSVTVVYSSYRVFSVTRLAGGSWGTPEVMFVPSTNSTDNAELAVSPTGESVAIWGDEGHAYAVSRSSADSVWSAPAELGSTAPSPAVTAVIDASGAATVAWRGPDAIRTARRAPGQAWAPAETLPNGYDFVQFPQLAVGRTGYLTTLTGGGGSWIGDPDTVAESTFATQSRDRDRSWEAEKASGVYGYRANGSVSLSIGPDDSTTAVWVSDMGQGSCAVRTADLPRGGTWPPARILSPDCYSSPNIALNASGDAVAVWSPNGSQSLTGDGIYIATRAFGRTWSAPHRVYVTDLADMSSLAVGPSGTATLLGIVKDESTDTWTVRSLDTPTLPSPPTPDPPTTTTPTPTPDGSTPPVQDPAPPGTLTPSQPPVPTVKPPALPSAPVPGATPKARAALGSSRVARGRTLTIRVTNVANKAKLTVTWKPKRGKATRRTVTVKRGVARAKAPKANGPYRLTVTYRGNTLLKNRKVTVR